MLRYAAKVSDGISVAEARHPNEIRIRRNQSACWRRQNTFSEDGLRREPSGSMRRPSKGTTPELRRDRGEWTDSRSNVGCKCGPSYHQRREYKFNHYLMNQRVKGSLFDILRRCICPRPQAIIWIQINFVPNFDGIEGDSGSLYWGRRKCFCKRLCFEKSCSQVILPEVQSPCDMGVCAINYKMRLSLDGGKATDLVGGTGLPRRNHLQRWCWLLLDKELWRWRREIYLRQTGNFWGQL